MQADELLKSLEGMGDLLAGFQKQHETLTPILEEIRKGVEGVDPSLMAKYDETMKDLNAKKAELEAVKKSVNDIKL